jgi:hypothetical protein
MGRNTDTKSISTETRNPVSDANSPTTPCTSVEGLLDSPGKGSLVTGFAAASAGHIVPIPDAVDMVNSPPHYSGPNVECPNCGHVWPISCIQIIRSIRDGRLFSAMKYIWRVALGGGKGNDVEDVEKARWFLTDFIELPSSR